MKEFLRRFAYSFGIALILTVIVGVVASVSKLSAVGVLLAPGMLAAAILFPEGIHSNWANAYLAVSGLMNAFLLAWPVLWIGSMIGHARQRQVAGK
jgi:hypothetical protein